MGTYQELVGLEIGNYAVKAAQLSGKPHKVRLNVLDREILPQTQNQAEKDQATIDTIKRIFTRNAITSKKVAITVPASTTTVKKIQIPKVAKHLLREAVSWEAEQYLPFDLADFQLDFQLLPEGTSPYHQLLLVAAPKETISKNVELVRKAGLEPEIMDVPALALEKQYALNYHDEKNSQVCLLDIGAKHTVINVLRTGYTIFSHVIPIGGQDYTKALQDKLGVAYIKAETIKQQQQALPEDIKAELNNVSDKLALELKRLLDPSKVIFNELEIEKFFLSGGGCLSSGLANRLQINLGKPVVFLNPLNAISLKKINFPPEIVRPYLTSMPIAIGLGLRCWPDANFKRG